MTAEAIIAIVACAGSFIGPSLVVAFHSGSQRRRIDNVEDNVNRVESSHGERLDGHEVRLNTHAEQLASSEGWRKGFEAALKHKN